MKTCDPTMRARFATLPRASGAKRLGRMVKLRADWDAVRIDAMRTCLALKFDADSPLAIQLRRTGDAELVEGNDWNDTYWGVVDGVGENHLGLLLMERRALLRAEGAPT